jgi:hypothetical protein
MQLLKNIDFVVMTVSYKLPLNTVPNGLVKPSVDLMEPHNMQYLQPVFAVELFISSSETEVVVPHIKKPTLDPEPVSANFRFVLLQSWSNEFCLEEAFNMLKTADCFRKGNPCLKPVLKQ